ncbi:MAG TPA: VCBS repeat-containing protein [Verrucomicrobiae bacterium]|nr:VCBS repeat-containing protein [Verrucomicrobiae bacterium]
MNVLINKGSGGFRLTQSLGAGPQPNRVAAVVDVNGDGLPDLISVNKTDGTLTVLTNAGGGVFSFYALLNVGVQPQAAVSLDVHGDGKPDLAVANFDGTMTLLVNTINFPSAAPKLMTSVGAGNLYISWPASASNYVLQTNPTLARSNWSTSGLPITTSTGTNSVSIVVPSSGSLFFRLKE